MAVVVGHVDFCSNPLDVRPDHEHRPKAEGGSGLNTKPYDPQPGTEKTSPVDSTPVGEYLNGARAKKPKQRVQHAKAS